MLALAPNCLRITNSKQPIIGQRGFHRGAGVFRESGGMAKVKRRVDETRIAAWCVARTLRSLNRVEEALSRQMALKDDFKSVAGSDGYVFEEIGECLLALNRPEEARPYFSQAYEILAQDIWLAEQEPERLARMKELGE